MTNNRPIGVFDSGVGGLTVLKALQRHLPHESTVYVGDLARCPYGIRPQDQVRKFAVQIGDMLVDSGVKLLVIACNTATAAAYECLRERYEIPVVGVIDPAVDVALGCSTRGRIGVVATDGTVESAAYTRAIRIRAPHAVILERSASWLVPIIERGAIARSTVARELAPVMLEMDAHDVEALILGCTHFPLVRDIFEAGTSSGMAIVDSADTTATSVAELLARSGLRSFGVPTHRLLVTGPAEAFAERAQAMFRTSPRIETIDLPLPTPASLHNL